MARANNKSDAVVQDAAASTPEALDPSVTEDHVRAAEKRKAAATPPDANAGMIAALLEERRGYVTRGLKDRVAQVDESLAHYGYTGE